MDYENWLRVCEAIDKKEPVITPDVAFKEAIKLIKDFQKEHFIGLYLNTKNKVIHSEVISMGTLNYTVVHAREVYKPAFIHSANSIIIIHNHPSGDITPSHHDNVVTQKLHETGEVLDIKMLDHLIIGKDKYYSYSKEGTM